MKRPILGLVLCGGASRRMGEDKAALQARPGLSQLEYAFFLLAPFCERLAAATGRSERGGERPLPAGVEAVVDADGFGGPMGGLVAGLRYGAGRPVLVMACDMPYLEASLVLQLIARRDPERVATAFLGADGLPEPAFALYEPRCLALLEDRGRRGELSLRRFLCESDVERIALDRPRLLASVNDREELERARREFS